MDGWSDPSIGRMPAGARNSPLPIQFFFYSGDADASSNHTVSFRLVVTPSGLAPYGLKPERIDRTELIDHHHHTRTESVLQRAGQQPSMPNAM